MSSSASRTSRLNFSSKNASAAASSPPNRSTSGGGEGGGGKSRNAPEPVTATSATPTPRTGRDDTLVRATPVWRSLSHLAFAAARRLKRASSSSRGSRNIKRRFDSGARRARAFFRRPRDVAASVPNAAPSGTRTAQCTARARARVLSRSESIKRARACSSSDAVFSFSERTPGIVASSSFTRVIRPLAASAAVAAATAGGGPRLMPTTSTSFSVIRIVPVTATAATTACLISLPTKRSTRPRACGVATSAYGTEGKKNETETKNPSFFVFFLRSVFSFLPAEDLSRAEDSRNSLPSLLVIAVAGSSTETIVRAPRPRRASAARVSSLAASDTRSATAATRATRAS
mmetsp:Transcript_13037/g.55564  ORF Transcript_13037/g.55564 Transcript_13037/m.55564 type:complete len:346 (-) Transcript_13037:1178-2215(-)